MGILFNGTNQRVDFANESAFDLDWGQAFSVACWMYSGPTTDGGSAMISKAGTGQGWAFDCNNSSNATKGCGFSLHLIDSGEVWVYSPAKALIPGVWTHVAATYDGSSTAAGINLYLNGLSVPTGGFSANVDAAGGSILNNQPLAVGGIGAGTEWCNVAVANAVFAKVTWSAADVKALARTSNFSKNPDTLLSAAPFWWAPLPTTSDLTDHANGNNGSVVGAPTTQADPKVVYIGHRGQGQLAGTSATVTFTTTADILAGQHVVVGDTHFSTGMHGDITDVTVGSLSLAKDKLQLMGSSPVQSEIWSAPATTDIASGATVTVTYASSTSDTGIATCDVFDGLATSNVTDQTAGAGDSGGAATTFDSGTTATTAQADEAAYTVFGFGLSATDPLLTPAAGWFETVEIFDGTNLHHESSFKILTATGTQRHQPTAGTGEQYCGAIATYRSDPGGKYGGGIAGARA